MRLKKLLRAKKKRAKSPESEVARLVVGLRNPGRSYEGTRHNLGFEVVERVLDRAGVSLGRSPSRVSGLSASIGDPSARALVLVPTTFMNESGRAVRAMLDYYRLNSTQMLVVHDDIDLDFGRLRLQVAGGSGGHNGIRSVETALGSNEFSRLKVGIGRPPGSRDPAGFVLERFSKRERPEVDVLIEDAADVVELWLTNPTGAQEAAALRGRND